MATERITTDYGFALIEKDEDHVRIDYIEIAPEHRGKGHATELVEKAIVAARRIADKKLPVKIVAHEYDAEVISLSDLVDFYERWFTIEDVAGSTVIMAL